MGQNLQDYFQEDIFKFGDLQPGIFGFFQMRNAALQRSIQSHRRANVYARARLKSTMAASFGVCRLRLRALGGLDKFSLGLEPQTQVRFTSTTSATKAHAENKTAKAGNIVFL